MAALSGEKTLAELSAEFGVYPTIISDWKQELVKRAGELFARGNRAPAVGDAQKVIDDLHRKIGQLLKVPRPVSRGCEKCPGRTDHPTRSNSRSTSTPLALIRALRAWISSGIARL